MIRSSKIVISGDSSSKLQIAHNKARGSQNLGLVVCGALVSAS